MSNSGQVSARVAKLPLLAALFALFGIGDTVYLTYHHYTAEPVPCSLLTGCEQVLNSQWATLGGFLPVDVPAIAGIPLALLGLGAYAVAFVLAAASVRGKRLPWFLFGLQATAMVSFSAWLFYIQAYRIEAFCQFCLISAATSLSLFIVAVISRFWKIGDRKAEEIG